MDDTESPHRSGPGGQADPERPRRVFEVFEAVVELEAPAQRAYLARVAADEPSVAAEVEALLRYDRGDEHLKQLIGDAAASVLGSGMAPGATVGAYRLVGELGHGGMGTIWLAVRDDDAYRQQVAIKLLHGTASEDLQARFRAERQILASLEHPNIVRLLDGGATDDGTPYVVMEHVRGRPINRYCAEEARTTEERLELFCQVCAAVQHAHRHLIVHRDIKPTNILVDETGTPKLLDFGIAKLLGDSFVPEPPPETRTGAVMLTPLYASPEQIRGERITTATDVYALGVLLYELLTGRSPYRVKTQDPVEVARAVCVEDPLPPSTVVTTVVEGQGVPPPDGARLSRRLAGDLDNIVLMALRKEPAQRYGSALDLADDVRRHLERLPVTARPSTLRYRIGKFISRYRWQLAAAVIVAVVLLGATIVSVGQMRVAVQARATAERERGVALTQARRATYMAANARIDARNPLAALHLLWTVEADQRGWEWHYLWTRLDRSLAVIRAPDAVAAGLTPGGGQVVTLSGTGQVRWWSPEEEQATGRSEIVAGAIRHAVFALDGERVAIAYGPDGDHIAIWRLTPDRAPSRVFDRVVGAPVTGLGLSFSGEGLVATSRDSTWFRRHGVPEPTVWPYGSPGSPPAVAGDGQLAAVLSEAGRGTYRVLDPRAPARADTLVSRYVAGVAISPTGSQIAAGENDGVIRVRDGATQRTVLRL
ncbi:MAG TPA: serine/threonine-protein kinase, partial [Gemmatimonadales bacterium]|nr:serine/threonine-protein kinase [Gemmatimonadales bacterium]